MGGQIGPIMQAHAVGIERDAIGGEQTRDEASESGEEDRHFVTSFQVGAMTMAPLCAQDGTVAMDKVAALL